MAYDHLLEYARPKVGRFTNTRLLSPVAIEGITRAEKGSYEWHEWWEQQHKYCTEGYEVAGTRISGRHYHYLNFTQIRQDDGQGNKRWLAPRFTDIDHEYYWTIEYCSKTKKDLLILKRRQCGYSYKGGHLAAYEYQFVPSSRTIITAGESKYHQHTWDMWMANFHYSARTEFYKHPGVRKKTDEYISGIEVEIDGKKSVLGFNSSVRQMTATTPQAMVGTSGSLYIYEEISKFKGVSLVKGYADAGAEQNNRKTGWSILFGTGGEEDATSLAEVSEMFYKPDLYNLLAFDNIYEDEDMPLDDVPKTPSSKVCMFVPGYKFLEIDDDGNSLIPESKKILDDRREAKKGNRKAWMTEVTQYPKKPSEALLTPGGNMFNGVLLNQRKAYLMRTMGSIEYVKRGRLEWTYDARGEINGVEWFDDHLGPYRKTEDPRTVNGVVPEGLYIAATDSYDKDKTADVKRQSFGAIRIHKQFHTIDDTHDIPVCALVDRPDTSFEFYEMTAKLCWYYGNAPQMNLIEASNLLIFHWYRQNGFGHLIRQRPALADAVSPNSKVVSRDGIDASLLHIALQKAVDYVEKNVGKLNDIELIDKLIKYQNKPDYNCDETVAFAWSILHAEDNKVTDHMKKQDDGPEWRLPRYRIMEGGRMARY